MYCCCGDGEGEPTVLVVPYLFSEYTSVNNTVKTVKANSLYFKYITTLVLLKHIPVPILMSVSAAAEG